MVDHAPPLLLERDTTRHDDNSNNYNTQFPDRPFTVHDLTPFRRLMLALCLDPDEHIVNLREKQ